MLNEDNPTKPHCFGFLVGCNQGGQGRSNPCFMIPEKRHDVTITLSLHNQPCSYSYNKHKDKFERILQIYRELHATSSHNKRTGHRAVKAQTGEDFVGRLPLLQLKFVGKNRDRLEIFTCSGWLFLFIPIRSGRVATRATGKRRATADGMLARAGRTATCGGTRVSGR